MMQSGYWQYLDIFYRIPIFWIGLLLGLYAAEDRALTARSAALWTASLALGIAYAVLKHRVVDTAPVFLPLVHLFLLTTVPMCLALCALFEKLPLLAVRRALRLIGRNSLEIYLLNVSFFSQVETIRRYLRFGPTNRLYYLITFVVNIAFGCLLHLAVETCKNRIISHHKGERIDA